MNGFGGFGNNNGFGQAATAAAQNEILLGQQFGEVNNKLNDIGKGICDSAYALNNSITGEGRNLQNQLANCCCENRLGIANLGAQMDRQTCDITTAIHAEADATRAMMKDDKIKQLEHDLSSMELEKALCGVVRYPTQMSYCSPCNPFCCPEK